MLVEQTPERKYNQFITMFDVLFGSYCMLFLIVTTYSWMKGLADGVSVVTIATFTAFNVGVSKLSIHSRRQLLIEKVRIWLAPTLICPLAFIFATAPFGPWWGAYVIHAMAGSVILALSPRSKWKITFYLAQLGLSLILTTLFSIS